MASSGVCVSAQMPPAMPNSVRIRIRNALRALASMMRSTSFGAPECWSVEVSVSIITPSLLGSLTPILHSALHFGLGVDEEVGAGNNTLALLQSSRYRVVIAIFASEIDETRLQPAFAFVHENRTALAGGHDGADRDGQRFAHIHTQLHIHIHLGSKLKLGVRKDEADAAGAFGVVDERINQINRAAEFFVRVGRSRDDDRHPDFQ